MAKISEVDAPYLQKRLIELFNFDPGTGQFTYKRTRGKVGIGAVAGSLNKAHGYREIMLDYKSYRAHRLVWVWCFGEWPPVSIDHINGQKDDNRPANLRLANANQNNANIGLTARNTSGIKGVSQKKGRTRWQAFIRYQGRTKFIGSFPTPDQAAAAYREASLALHGQFSIFKRGAE